MKTFLATLLCLCSISLFGQINTNLETKPFTTCVLPNCNPGGEGVPTSTTNERGTAKGFVGDLEIGVGGPAYTNALFYLKVGATTANYFISEFDAYIPNQTVQAYEYDAFVFSAPYEFMFGSQCVTGGNWQIWDQLNPAWHDTPLPCRLKTGWHHIEWFVHRVPGDTSCNGYPCEHYDTLGIDYVYTTFNLTQPAGPIPPGWNNDSGIQFQLDINAAGGGITEYLRRVNLLQLP
jgi:hypothetical protein